MGTSEEQIEILARSDAIAAKWQRKGYFCREQPQHTVTLPAFHIAKYPATVGEYRGFVAAGGYQDSAFWTPSGWAWCQRVARRRPDHWLESTWAGDDRLPVVGITWHEATVYCRWLSHETGDAYRLPTEAEWEKAARGTSGWLYPWGDKFEPDRCLTRVSGLEHTRPVGEYSPLGESPYGCAEMAGNASEWTQSQFKPYPYRDEDGRNDPHGEGERAIRGGSWFKPIIRARTAARGMNDPHFSDSDVGFRLACG
jgi:formylglycine-generating enzyme required for sulfatase activity